MSVSSHDSVTRHMPVIQYYILLVNCSVTQNLMEGRIQTGYWRGHSRTHWKSWPVTSQDLTEKYDPGTARARIATDVDKSLGLTGNYDLGLQEFIWLPEKTSRKSLGHPTSLDCMTLGTSQDLAWVQSAAVTEGVSRDFVLECSLHGYRGGIPGHPRKCLRMLGILWNFLAVLDPCASIHWYYLVGLMEFALVLVHFTSWTKMWSVQEVLKFAALLDSQWYSHLKWSGGKHTSVSGHANYCYPRMPQ